MRKFILLILLLASSWVASSQDRIIKHNSDTIRCVVTELSEEFVRFKYLDEELITVMSLRDVNKILLKSGREIDGKPRVVVRGIEDCGNVVVVTSAQNLDGLVRVARLTSTPDVFMLGGSYADINTLRNNAINDFRYRAAMKQCHLVVITSEESTKGIPGTKIWPSLTMTADIYRYPEVSEVGVAQHFIDLVEKGDFERMSASTKCVYLRLLEPWLRESINNSETTASMNDIDCVLKCFETNMDDFETRQKIQTLRALYSARYAKLKRQEKKK